MQNIESHVLPPLVNPTNPPFLFCFFKNLLRLKINILSSVYLEINFPAEHVMKINNLSRPKVPAPPPSESNGRPLIFELFTYQLILVHYHCLGIFQLHSYLK